jgi:hypothetical protein
MYGIPVAQILIKFIVQGCNDGNHIHQDYGTFFVYRFPTLAGSHPIFLHATLKQQFRPLPNSQTSQI